MSKRHLYETRTTWTGNQGEGTVTYRGYRRWFDTTAAGRPKLLGSSDPTFRGDADRWNPELLLVALVDRVAVTDEELLDLKAVGDLLVREGHALAP